MAKQDSSWGNPGPWCFFAVGILCACVGASFSGLVSPGSQTLLIGIVAACAIPQIIGAIILFRRGDMLLASTAGLFGTVVSLGAAFTISILVWGGKRPADVTSEAMAMFWITVFFITLLIAIAFGRVSWFLFGAIIVVAVAFLFRGLYELIPSPLLVSISGYLLMAFAVCSIYGGTAMLFHEHFDRVILPVGKPIFK